MSKYEPQSLEHYLSQIAHELRALPPQARADEMREIEAHLRALIEARGDVAAVLAQFGSPRKVGRDLRRAWERKQPEGWINGALAFVIGYLFVCGHNYFWFTSARFNWFFNRFQNFSSEGLFALIMGIAIGFVSPKRAFMITFVIFPFLIALDLLPLLSTGFKIYSLSFFAMLVLPKYISLFVFLLIGTRFGAHFGRKIDAKIANAK